MKTIQEIITDPKCSQYLSAYIAEVRLKRSFAQHGKFKRTPFDILDESGMLTPTKLLNEFILICEKKSNQPAAVRDYIIALVNRSMAQTMQYYRKKELAAIPVE